jgi:hypothetical protein
MIIAIGILAFLATCALSLVGLGESHSRVTRILNEMNDERVKEETTTNQAPPTIEPQAQKQDVFAEVGFTRSLLALSKVRSLDPYEAPILARDESSLLASVRHAQSKNRAPVL